MNRLEYGYNKKLQTTDTLLGEIFDDVEKVLGP